MGALLIAAPVSAQRSKAYVNKASTIVEKYKTEIESAGRKATESTSDADKVTLSPFIYQLIGPGVYYHSAIDNHFKLDYELPSMRGKHLIATEGMDYRDGLNSAIGGVLTQSYIERPSMFRYYDAQIDAENIVTPASVKGAKKEDLESIYDKVDEIRDVADVLGDVDVKIHIEKPNFWNTQGRASLQFTQNYFSENWYKGGDNNVTLLSNIVLEANYNDQQKIQWDNKLDMRLGFVTATADTCHTYLTNNDKIYLFSKLGVKAAKSWFYTLSVEANTQFLPGYKTNDTKAYSKFLAPLDVYVSLGMDFKPTMHKKDNSLSVALLPLSYKMRYIGVDDENIISTYNMKHHNFQQDFGSKIEMNAKIEIVKGLTWRCRSFYFTSYKYVEAEMENVFAFQFNKYITSEVNTVWRFDDNRNPKDYNHTLGYFQFKEYFTLGLAYNF